MKEWLLRNPNNAKENAIKWNFIASAVNASEAILVLMIATRTVGITDAGILTIAFTVANMLMCVGKYGVRNYQVTDSKEEYSFIDYLQSRKITLGMMAIVSLIYLAFSSLFISNSFRKTIIIALVIAMYGVEAYEDVFLSGLQHNGRLDSGTKMFSARWVVTIVIWCAILVITRDTVISTAVALVVNIVLVIIFTNSIRNACISGEVNNDFLGIIKKCFPLCVATILSIYLPNAAKYSIDMCLTDADQAYYGFIAMPIFVVDLISQIIFQPFLVDLSKMWKEKDYLAFKKMISKLKGLVLIVSVVVIFCGYIIGIQILSLLYATDLTSVKIEFMLLLVASSALGFIGIQTAILTIIRKQKLLMYGYLAMSIIGVISLNHIVNRFGLTGAASENMLLLIGLALLLAFFSRYNINKMTL